MTDIQLMIRDYEYFKKCQELAEQKEEHELAEDYNNKKRNVLKTAREHGVELLDYFKPTE